MSYDYSTGKQALRGTVLHGSIINGTLLIEPGYIWSKSFEFLVLAVALRIRAAATTDRAHTFKLQLSDSAGAFTSPTDLVTFSIATTDAAGTQFFSRVPVASADIVGNGAYVLRVVHIANGVDTTLDYDVEVFTTSRHE